jgi:hypothetical protein
MERTNDDDEFLVLYRLYNTHISLAVSNSAPPENKVESEERKKKQRLKDRTKSIAVMYAA